MPLQNKKEKLSLLLPISFKTDLSPGWLWWIQQLFQVSKYESNVFIVPGKFLFYLFKLQ